MSMKILNETEGFSLTLQGSGYEGGYCISERLRDIASDICSAQGMRLPLQKILFLYDKTPYKSGPIGRVMLLPVIAKDLFYQASGCMFEAALVINHNGMQQLLEAQFSNELYHCLRHFSVNEKTGAVELIRRHNVEQWEEQASYSNGIDSFPADAPDLFDERIYPLGEIDNEGVVNADGFSQVVGTQDAPCVA